jgi:ribosomal protein S18 acetylase RimI-like enzyme
MLVSLVVVPLVSRVKRRCAGLRKRGAGTLIRKATERDIEIIAEYNCWMAEETENIKLDRERVIKGVRNAIRDTSKAVYYLKEIEGKIAGQLMVTKEWSDWRDGYFWWIQSVYVHRDYRNQGIFSELYRHIEQLVKGNTEACGIRLYVHKNNGRAQKVYNKLGMNETAYLLYEMEK